MPKSNPLRVGLIGAGSIARVHLPGFLFNTDLVRLSAVFDVNPDAAQSMASDAGDAAVFNDVASLLASDLVDAVDICTPHDQHRELAIAAAEAGKHVLLEKPMACSMEDCVAIVDACDRAGVTLMAGQSLRYVPSNSGVKELIEAGKLGQIWSGTIEEFLPLDETPRPVTARSWYNDAKRAGGGVLITQSTHHIDLFRYFLGDIDRVSCAIWTGHPGYTNGAEDRATATLVFRQGATVQLVASNSSRIERFRFTLIGEDGTVFTDIADDARMGLKHQAPSFAQLREQGPLVARPGMGVEIPSAIRLEPSQTFPSDEAFINEIQHFAESCLNGTEPLSSGRDNLGTMSAIFALYESARNGGAWIDVVIPRQT